ncbi:unnamed protein product [Rotaria sp. Silwood1]|nr:unnamed protein product [Rotaria sp. Silwood1]CAF1670510.1 unnamed protein product [Rotaria sp. Silwood1]
MSNNVLTKKELEKLIEDRDESVKFVQEKVTSKTSELWQFYHHIFVKDHQQQFVSCNTCKTLLLVTPTSGTNTLKSHHHSCVQRKDKSIGAHQQTVHDFYSSSKQTTIPKQLKLRVTQAWTEFYATYSRAFNLITSDGFQNLANVLFDAGRSMYKSSIQIKDLLPHPTTTGRNVSRLYEEYKLHLVVCHVRRSNQQESLSKKRVSYSETRFNGGLIMMDNFLDLFFELRSALINSSFMVNYNLIEKDLLNDVSRRLNNASPVTDEHRLATILHPKLKHFDCCRYEKEKSIDILKLEFKKHQSIISLSYTNSLTPTYGNLQSSSSASAPDTATKPKNLLVQCFDAKVNVVVMMTK